MRITMSMCGRIYFWSCEFYDSDHGSILFYTSADVMQMGINHIQARMWLLKDSTWEGIHIIGKLH